MLRRTLLTLLLVPLGGFTECEHFSEVTIPAADNDDPIPIGRFMSANGTDDIIRLGTVRENVASLDQTFVPIAAVFDNGGAGSLSISERGITQCFDPQRGLGSASNVRLSPDLADSQTGSVGATVSDGIYLIGRVTRLRDVFVPCGPGFELVSVEYQWTYAAHDFGGNQISGLGGIISYAP